MSLRGGASDSEEEVSSSAKANLWGSISSVFEMNIEAKDELIHDDTDSVAESVITEKKELKRGTAAEVNAVTEEDEETTDESEIDDLEEESEEEEEIRGIVHRSEVATSSSRLVDHVEGEGEGEGEVDKGESDTNDDDEEESESDSADDTVEEVDEEDDLAELAYTVEESEDEFSDSNNEATHVTPSVTNEDADSSDKFEDSSNNPGENISIYTDLDSTSDSETFPEEIEIEEEDSAPLPTFEEIAREEWSMIPETEGEGEGEENELEAETMKGKRKQKKKKHTNKKNGRDAQRKMDEKKGGQHKRGEVQAREIGQVTPQDEQLSEQGNRMTQLPVTASKTETPPPAETIKTSDTGAESSFISSGFVSDYWYICQFHNSLCR